LNDDPPPPTIDLLRAFGSANLNLSINLATDIPVVIDYYPSSQSCLPVVVDHLMEIFTEIPKDKLERSIELVRNVLPPRNNNNNQDELIKQEEEEKDVDVDVDVDVVRVVDPLKLDLGEEELTMKAEVPPPLPLEPSRQQQEEAEEEEPQQAELQVELSLIDNENDDLVPLDLSLVAKRSVIETTLKRICYGGTLDDNSSVAAVNERIWVTLITRLITRRSKNDDNDDDDRLREILFEFVMKDFENRFELARLWLNEEWYTRTSSRYYDLYLSKFFDHIIIQDSNDFASKNLFKFMIDLPSLPLQELKKFEQMCLSESDLMPLGFNMLRELTRLRPSREIRFNTLDILLGLTTHSDKRIRNAAIMSVKKWVPEVEQLSRIIVDFALSLLQRLKVEPPQPEIKPEGEEQEEEEEEMEIDDGETPEPAQAVLPFGLVRQGKVVDRLPPPQTIGQVTQHVELLLALCVKQPELLQPLFEEYPRMTLLCRESLQELITPLIRSLGIKHVGIVGLFENFPPGSDLLLLKLVEILADKQKLPNDLVQRIKDVAKTRELDSKLYALIMPDCHKEEILKYLPKVVGLLDSSSRQKASIRSIFLSIIQPPQHFSAVNSLRSRSDSISPVELMTFLHKHDREIGIKQTIEAIAICFSMADAFRPEILAAFMQQIVDKESVLPNLFLRTVIQSVTTYKSLQPFVSTTLLSRLISKKIWEHPQLWQGFIRCAKVIMPSSFAALLQLPKEWLKDLIEKQPSMRQPLKEYVLKSKVIKTLSLSLSGGIHLKTDS
jgi:symplekin